MIKKPTRLRIKACEILNREFPYLDVKPDDIVPATGRWRSDIRFDVFRWELRTRRKDGRAIQNWGCWDTLTRFVKEASKVGCSLCKDGFQIYIGRD